MKNIRRILVISATALVLAFCMPAMLPAGSGTIDVHAKPHIHKKKFRIKAGETVKVRLINRGKKKVRWFSTNPRIATIKAGKVTGISKGRCKIYAVYGKKKRRAYAKVIVRNSKFRVSDSYVELNKKESQTIVVYSGTGFPIAVRSDDDNIAVADPLSSPGSKIAVRIKARYKSGTAHITIRDKRSGRSRRVTVVVKGTNQFKLTNSSDANIVLKQGRMANIWITCDSGSQISGSVHNPGNISCGWGSYQGNNIPFYVKGIEKGTSTIWFKDPGTNKSIRINITVK